LPLKEGWGVSPDKNREFEQLLSTDEVGDPILTSRCYREGAYGFLVVGNKGIVWKNTQSGVLSAVDAVFGSGATVGKSSKGVSWRDVVIISPFQIKKPYKSPGSIKIQINRRRNGELLTNKRGIQKTEVWAFKIRRNLKETNFHFKQRKAEFFGIMKELYNLYKTDKNPPTSDSRIKIKIYKKIK